MISKKPELRRQEETDGDMPRALTYAQMEQRHLELQNQYQQYQNQYHHQNGQLQVRSPAKLVNELYLLQGESSGI